MHLKEMVTLSEFASVLTHFVQARQVTLPDGEKSGSGAAAYHGQHAPVRMGMNGFIGLGGGRGRPQGRPSLRLPLPLPM